MKKVYIVTLCIDNRSDGIDSEIIGVYSTFRKAQEAAHKSAIEEGYKGLVPDLISQFDFFRIRDELYIEIEEHKLKS